LKPTITNQKQHNKGDEHNCLRNHGHQQIDFTISNKTETIFPQNSTIKGFTQVVFTNTSFQDEINQKAKDKQFENERKVAEDIHNYALNTEDEIIITSWNVIATPKKRGGQIEVREVVTNIMVTLKNEACDILLIETISDDESNKNLTATKNIPLTETEVKKFIKDPGLKNSNKLTFQIQLGSKRTLET
jgi:hypothetical protein